MKGKFNFWRKALSVLTLATFAVSCSQETEVEPIAPSDKGHLITFDVATTRGAINSTVSEFWVYAVDSQNEVVLDNVKYTLTGGKWKAAEDCYSNDPEIDFYFYTPSSASVTFNGKSLVYNMPEDVVSQPDILVGSTLDANPAQAISLKFNRALAMVKFVVTGANESPVTSITMSNVSGNGTFDFDAMSWSNLGTASETAYSAGIKTDVTNGGEGTNITNEDGYLIVIPQTASPNFVVTTSVGATQEFSLENVNWEAGNIYPYTIGIDGIKPDVPANPDQNPKGGMFDLDEYSQLDGNKRDEDYQATHYVTGNTFLEDLNIAIANGIKTFVITGTYSGMDNVFGQYNAFADITDGTDYTVDISAVTGWPANTADSHVDPNFSVHLPNWAFMNADKLSKIIIPEAIEMCGDKAFYGCTALKEVENIDTVWYLGQYAFYQCTSLEELDVPAVRDTYGSILSGCTSLKTVKMTYSGDLSDVGESSSFSTDTFWDCPTEQSVLYLHMNQKINVTKNADGTYFNADWKGHTWKEIKFVDDNGDEVDPSTIEMTAYIDLSDPNYATAKMVADAVDEFDELGCNKYVVVNNNGSDTEFTGNNKNYKYANPFSGLKTPNVTLDLSGVTTTWANMPGTNPFVKYWDSNYFVHNSRNSYNKYPNIVKVIMPNTVKGVTGSFQGMPDLEEIVATNSDFYTIGTGSYPNTFSCAKLKTLSLIGYYQPGSWVANMLGTCPTTNVTLYLSYEDQKQWVSVGSNKKVYWAGYVWKEIVLVDTDGVTVKETFTSL